MRWTRRRLLVAAASGAAAGTLGYAWRIEPVWLRIYREDVVLPRLAPAFDGFRIVQLSDFHVGAGVPDAYLRDAVHEAIALQPDLIALTGDFVHRGDRLDKVARVAEILAPLGATGKAYAVLGNHDAEAYFRGGGADEAAMARVGTALTGCGVHMLQNRRVVLRRGAARLHLEGTGDLWSGFFFPQALPPVDPAIATVLLTHNPDAVPRLAPRAPDLVLSGHTHGGQVRIPFLGPPILPVRHREWSAGLYRVGKTQLYVNRGVGWLQRVRLFVRPELTVLTLRV